jgi:plasmid stabilization system protein ParE
MRLRLSAAAEAELDEAVAWYRAQAGSLSQRFLDEIRAGRDRIGAHPNAWQPLGDGIRRYRLATFPYGLIYEIVDGEINVLAVAHLHREPDYWRNRLRR